MPPLRTRLSTPYTEPSNSPPQHFQRSTIGYLSNSWVSCFVGQAVTTRLVLAMITSRLHYCNSVLAPHNGTITEVPE